MKAKAWLASPSQGGPDALNPTYAPLMTYGPLHLRLGADLVDSAHSESSYQLGSDAMYAMLTRGGYIDQHRERYPLHAPPTRW